MSDWYDCLIGFGANLGDLYAAFEKTQKTLATAEGVRNLVASRAKLTKPVGGPGQPQYLNAVFRLQTNRTAEELHALLVGLECEAGRDRMGRWKPRTLDLDLLLFGTETIHTETLHVPHPRMSVRRFVLEPAAEIAGEMIHPAANLNLSQLLDHLNQGPNRLVWVSDQNEIAESVISGAKRHLARKSTTLLNSSDTPQSQLTSWEIVRAPDRATFLLLCPTAKILVWSNPRPSELREARFAGPQIELPEKNWTIDKKPNSVLLENVIVEFQSEIVAAIEAADG